MKFGTESSILLWEWSLLPRIYKYDSNKWETKLAFFLPNLTWACSIYIQQDPCVCIMEFLVNPINSVLCNYARQGLDSISCSFRTLSCHRWISKFGLTPTRVRKSDPFFELSTTGCIQHFFCSKKVFKSLARPRNDYYSRQRKFISEI